MKRIPLTKGKFAIIDAEDAAKISGMRFYAVNIGNKWYAKSKDVYLHHIIIGRPGIGFHTNHENGDGLDNRKVNLRHITHAKNLKNSKMNSRNSSGFRGVSFDRSRKKWIVVTSLRGKIRTIGRFNSKHAAALAFDKFTAQNFGTQISLNFPDLF